MIAGDSVRSIILDLNVRGVPSPWGRPWAARALTGDTTKGLGLLSNELYIGQIR